MHAGQRQKDWKVVKTKIIIAICVCAKGLVYT